MKAIFKFNGGLGALLCSSCRTIIKEAKDFSESEMLAFKGINHLPPQFCNKCVNNKS
jgi:hypothetical protein